MTTPLEENTVGGAIGGVGWEEQCALVDPILVHDYLLVMRGAERSFATICDMWPGAPVASLLYDERVFAERLAGHVTRTSALQHLHVHQRHFKKLMPLFPFAAERLDVSGHPVVISSSSAFAHGVQVQEGVAHVCYCYTPFRYAWFEQDRGIAQAPWLFRPAVRNVLWRMRDWDRTAAARGTHYVAISRLSQERIADFWDVEAPIVYPPVELSRFAPGEPEDFVLVVCELVRHKQVDVALAAAKRAGVRIKVVGGGADEHRLRAAYGDSAEFLGRVCDADLARLYSRALALVVPNVEEFGIAAVEAQASGRPVIAAGLGGALETVIEGQTGVFFAPGDIESLAEALRDAASLGLSSDACVNNAQMFSIERFKREFARQVVTATGGVSTMSRPSREA